MKKLSVIICSGGRPKSLKKTLASLENQSFKDWEMVVVKERPLVRARDLGWRRAKGEIVSWIDDDVVLTKNWAKNLVKIFDENKDVGGVSGPTIVPEKLLKNRLVFWWYKRDDWLAKMWVKWVLQGKPFDVGRIYSNGWWSPGSNFKSCLKMKGLWEVDYLEACNMSLRRSLVKKVGGVDMGYKGTAEWCELDLAMRVKDLGHRLVWNRGVRLRHEVSKSGVYVDRRKIGERVRNYMRFRSRNL
ncbi:MAG: glycosyltransferase family A protein [Patescibacteria group bacterium]|nr:glycosyltransferase family A protein [Patescibacteria group bacterium]